MKLSSGTGNPGWSRRRPELTTPEKWPQDKLKTMILQNLGVTKKGHYGMLWYFLEWSISLLRSLAASQRLKQVTALLLS